MFFGWTLPHTFFTACFLAVVFYLLLGIKELTFIERFTAYQVLELLLLFLTSWYFFETARSIDSGMSFFASLAPAAVFFFLTWNLSRRPELGGRLSVSREEKLRTFLEIGVASFILWQLALVLLFVPLGTFERSGLFLITNFFFVEILFSRGRGVLTRPRLLFNFSLVFIFVVGILAAAEWSV